MAKVYLSIEECFEAARALQGELESLCEPSKLKGIVAVLNGGLFPAYWLRKMWYLKGIDMPLQTIDVRSYKDYDRQGEVEILSRPDILDGAGWIFVDEIHDTGKTFAALRKEYPAALYASLTSKSGDGVDACALKFKPGEWIVFPWEMAEDKK